MTISKTEEIYAVVFCLICGIVTGMVFDIFRAMRRTFTYTDRAVALQDLVYWVIVLIIIYTSLYAINWAQIRLYEFIFIITGASVYFIILSKYCLGVICKITLIIYNVLKHIKRILSIPSKLFKKTVLTPFKRMFSSVYAKLTKKPNKIKASAQKICRFFLKS